MSSTRPSHPSGAGVRAVPRRTQLALAVLGLTIVGWLVGCVVPLAFSSAGSVPWTPSPVWYLVVPVLFLVASIELSWWARHRRTAQAFASVISGLLLAAILICLRVADARPLDAAWPHDLSTAVWIGIGCMIVGQGFAYLAERSAARHRGVVS